MHRSSDNYAAPHKAAPACPAAAKPGPRWKKTNGRAEERQMSFLSLFVRQWLVTATAERTRRINGLQGFPKRHGERDRGCHS